MKNKTPVVAIKNDAGKPRLELISEVAELGQAMVLTDGAKVYSTDNWRLGLEWRRCIGAARRHLNAFARGEDLDPKSGLPHIDHAACEIMFLSEFQKLGTGTDDRFKLVLEPTK